MFKKFLGLFQSRTNSTDEDEVPICASQRAPKKVHIDSDTLSRAVLDAIGELPRVIPCLVYADDLPELEDAENNCAKLREWAENSEELDKRTRREYLEWVRFCERDNAEARKMIETDYWTRHMAEIDAETEEQERRVAQVSVVAPPKFGR
jgi:hypothetical protein